jgi:hypothetical protein
LWFIGARRGKRWLKIAEEKKEGKKSLKLKRKKTTTKREKKSPVH